MAQGDHFSKAERLSRARSCARAATGVHATPAVVEQLTKVAEALDVLIRGQSRPHRGGGRSGLAHLDDHNSLTTQ